MIHPPTFRWRVMLGRVPVGAIVKNLVVTTAPQNWDCGFASEAAALKFLRRVKRLNAQFEKPKKISLEKRIIWKVE